MANTLLAYPYTKSDLPKAKIMSEIMMTKIVKALSPTNTFILSKNDSDPQEIISDGYYFYLNIGDWTGITNLYFYTDEESDVQNDFPELKQDGNGEIIFTTQQSFSNSTEHKIIVANLQTYDELIKPFYIANASDNTKTDKIWINSTDNAMNPYVYDGVNWVPLGAVYKS